MDKAKLKRHSFIYISTSEKQNIWQSLAAEYTGQRYELARDVFLGAADIPGIMRRDEKRPGSVAVGFVHQTRIDGNRIRIGVYAHEEGIVDVLTPYEVIRKQIVPRNSCMEACLKLYDLAESQGLQVGVLGSAGLELATGLPYTDEASDLDFLVKPSELDLLEEFLIQSRAQFKGINMDFELELPNGYGVKLAEMFMNTRTVLGKSLDNIDLLYKKDILQYLKRN